MKVYNACELLLVSCVPGNGQDDMRQKGLIK